MLSNVVLHLLHGVLWEETRAFFLHPAPSPAVLRAAPSAPRTDGVVVRGGKARGTEQSHILVFTSWLTGNAVGKKAHSQVPVHAGVETCHPIGAGVTRPLLQRVCQRGGQEGAALQMDETPANGQP